MGKRPLGGLVTVVFVLMLCGSPAASAATGSPLAIATGTHPEYLSVAVGGDGSAIAAWADKSTPGSDVVRWCVLRTGGSGCAGGGALTPAGGSAGFTYVYGTQVLVEGSTLVILADVDVGSKTEYESVQEWQSADGGQTFTAVNGGQAVASGNPSTDTVPLNAVALPGGRSLGFGFDTAAEAPSFHAFSLTAPTLCGRATLPTNCADGYATLAPASDADQVSNAPGNFVADGNAVLGVFRTNFSGGNLACTGVSPFGMAFVYGTGLQSTSNDYNVDPGKPQTAWRVPVTLADCDVDYLAAGVGPSGFGVLEDNQATGQTQYHRFDGATQAFDTVPTVVSSTGEQQPTVSQDGTGGVYATYLSGGIGGPVSLSHSSDGGATWTGPGTLAADPLGAVAGLISAVDAAGQGWAAWTANGSVFVQPFVAADAVPPTPSPAPTPAGPRKGKKAGAAAVTIAAAATSDGRTLTVGVSCATVPCTLQVLATAPAPAKSSGPRGHKAKRVKLGRGKFKIAKKGTRKLALKLSGAGRRYLAGKRQAEASLAVTEKVGGRKVVTRRTVSVKVSSGKRAAK
ncbi:MAG TPA: hypothetical protein VMF55_16415 [Solirubrobacterales bacterium]|nr:hypothetical protein [Solirubrobacterales bacterium]